MNDIQPLHIAGIIFIVEVVIAYLYWKNIPSPERKDNRAFDYLILTIAFGLLLSRVSGVLASSGELEGSFLRDLIDISNLKFNYYILILIPLFVHLLYSIEITRNPKWNRESLVFLIWGGIFQAPIIIGKIVLEVIEKQPESFSYNLSQLLLLGVFLLVTGIISLKYINKIWMVPSLSLVMFILWFIIDLVFPNVRSDWESIVFFLSNMAFWLFIQIPFIIEVRRNMEKPQRRSVRINQGR